LTTYLRVLEVMSPQWADFVLTTDVYEREREGERDEKVVAIVDAIAVIYSPQTVNEIFLYSTVSTLKPMVGIVVTISPREAHKERKMFSIIVVGFVVVALLDLVKISPTLKQSSWNMAREALFWRGWGHYSPNLSLYKIVVLPAASRPTICKAHTQRRRGVGFELCKIVSEAYNSPIFSSPFCRINL
jgi:hypothetical protein